MFKAIPGISKKIMVIMAVMLFLVSMVLFISPSKIYGATPVVYVDGGVAASGDGTAWYKAKKTIQEGITAVDPGGTVYVASGTYNENVTVSKSITLTGAGSGTTTVTAANAAVSVFNVTASSVNISGFTVSGATGGGQAGIYLGAGVTLCNIHDNILTGSFDGIWLGSGSNHNTITSNTTSNNTNQGFEVYISSDNTFTNNTANSNTAYGFKIDSGNNNVFTGNTANSNGKYGFYVVEGDGGGATNSTFTNNTANSNTQYGMRMNGGSGNTLIGNTFNLNVIDGIKLKEDIPSLTLTNNSFTNSQIGIEIDVSVANGIPAWTVSSNTITGNTLSISNAGTGTLNAINNWWGNATGPTHSSNLGGTGDAVSDNVNFTPWLVNPVGYVAPAPSKPLTPEEQASLNLSIAEQVDLYGATNIGFTKMLYDNILGRVSDAGGLDDWVTALNNGTITLGDVVYGFVFSKELEPIISVASPEEFITFLYENVLDRNADPDGFNNWVTLMQNGMTKEEVLLHFIDSDEFKSICEMFGLKP